VGISAISIIGNFTGNLSVKRISQIGSTFSRVMSNSRVYYFLGHNIFTYLLTCLLT